MALQRLDVVLVQKGFFPSRQRAKEAILQGHVLVDGLEVTKPSTLVDKKVLLQVTAPGLAYPSRAGLKLEKALAVFSVEVSGLVALDVGASAGGFTSCLLQKGARRVYAVDVGRDQLARELRQDPRVVVWEQTNIRHLLPQDLPEPADLATIDVSFISLLKVFPAVRDLLTAQGQIIALVKPQFETGGLGLNKHGVVHEQKTHLEFLPPLMEQLQKEDLGLQAFDFSPLKGALGNLEFLAHFKKGFGPQKAAALVSEAVRKGWQYHGRG